MADNQHFLPFGVSDLILFNLSADRLIQNTIPSHEILNPVFLTNDSKLAADFSSPAKAC